MERILAKIIQRDPEQKEFHQAVQEVMETVRPVLERNPEFLKPLDGLRARLESR